VRKKRSKTAVHQLKNSFLEKTMPKLVGFSTLMALPEEQVSEKDPPAHTLGRPRDAGVVEH
jgi:hypothetical protein